MRRRVEPLGADPGDQGNGSLRGTAGAQRFVTVNGSTANRFTSAAKANQLVRSLSVQPS